MFEESLDYSDDEDKLEFISALKMSAEASIQICSEEKGVLMIMIKIIDKE
jgi:hypothetical protein